MSTFRVGAVTGAYTDSAGITRVNVATGGPDGTPGVPVFNPGYFPRAGDNVLIVEVDTGVWVCLGTNRRDRGVVVPEVPSVLVQNTTPAGVGTIWDQISTTYAEHGVASMPDLLMVRSTTYTPPATTAGTLVQAATGSGNYSSQGFWDPETLRLKQGDHGYGNRTGLWVYPSMTAALAGKTVTRVRIDVTRAIGTGDYGPVQLHLWLHNHATIPTVAPTITDGPIDPIGGTLSVEASGTFDLPVAWGTAIKNGTSKGIATYSPSGSDYAAFYGPGEAATSGRLTIDYT